MVHAAHRTVRSRGFVETGVDRLSRVIDVLDIRSRGNLSDIANLGLMLSDGKQILARLQQAVVAVQADDHAVLRPVCSSCHYACHVKDWRLHRVATLFGTAAVRLPRFRCASCGHGETGVSWAAVLPFHAWARSTASTCFCSDAVSCRRRLLGHLLPVDAGTSPETPRGFCRFCRKVGFLLRSTNHTPLIS
jgi:hypothetical protein